MAYDHYPEEEPEPDYDDQFDTVACEYCDDGWVEGRPAPTPSGPHYPRTRCTACGGMGWVIVTSTLVGDDDDFFEEGWAS